METISRLIMNYHIKLSDNSKKEYAELPMGTYFCVGGNGAPKGQAMLMMWDNGTVLTPIYDINGKVVINEAMAGRELK